MRTGAEKEEYDARVWYFKVVATAKPRGQNYTHMHKHRRLTFRVKRLHVYFVNFFGIILLVAPLPFTSGGSVVGFLLQQVPGAVVDGDDLRGHLLGLGVLVRGAGELQFAQDLPPDRLDPLAHKLIHVEGAAGRQAESHGGQIQGEKHAQEIAVHFKCLNTAPPKKRVTLTTNNNNGGKKNNKKYQGDVCKQREDLQTKCS